VDRPQIVITDITDRESEDRQNIFVEGTLRNQGTGPTRQLQVQVNALDAAGQVVTTARAMPMPQTIQPGGSATFIVRFPNDPVIRSFHVEAEIR
jgi:hypothetical protein